MQWPQLEANPDGSVKIPSSWLFHHYYEALTILFRLENALRVFVYVILKNKYRSKWQDLSVTSEESQQGTIASIAQKRRVQAANFGYLCLPISCPMMQLTSGELIRLMLSNSEWPEFKEYFKASKTVVQNKLDEIGCVRNALAHFRPLTADDVQVLKQNGKQVFGLIEDCLTELHECRNTTPSNSVDEWYKELRNIGSDLCKLSFAQSESSSWVAMRLVFDGPTIAKNTYGTTTYYRVLSIRTPSLLSEFPALQELCTCATEIVSWGPGHGGDESFQKHVQLIFRRETLQVEHAAVKPIVEEILALITDEVEAIRQDNLIAGKLVFIGNINVTTKTIEERVQHSWQMSGLKCETSESHPPEYWGELPFFMRDYISDVDTFPWMPVTFANTAFF